MGLDRAISYVASLLLFLFALPFLVGGTAAWGGGLDYNPEFDGLAVPFGLFFVYVSLFNLRLSHPRIPWLGTPGFTQGCAFSWVGFVVVATLFALIGALLGRRPFDLPFLLTLWVGFLGIPFGLAWAVRWLRERGRVRATL
jgi:hypothetical protein